VPGLYAIVDPAACGSRGAIGTAEAIVAGGCAVLQLRWKGATDHEHLALARAMRGVTTRAGVLFVVNDRPDLARLSGADGLHLGQDDLSIADARTIVGSMTIGRSCHSLEQLAVAESEGADWLALGPIHPTASKERPDAVVGLAMLREAAVRVRCPLVAIGGIDLENAPAVSAAGATFGAVIGAVCRAADPTASARALHQALGGVLPSAASMRS
jgi:thiamine-phosphate pyrophosphorylase